ncbi:MAG TPA: hypothetical protein PLD25_28260 [Chloroflexota bacterium]|nr:hypothetical protein [Chloroflexota bacterium]HUM68039.1 hypothetical protein [Chloroflexota bacterium]
MSENTYLAVQSALHLAMWLWPALQPGVTNVTKKVGEAVGEALSQKLRKLFGERATKLDEIPKEQLDNVVNESITILTTLTYTDENLLRDIQLALNKLLQNENNFTLVDVHKLYMEFVNPNTQLAELIIQSPLSPQIGIAQKIVQNATVKRRLPELIEDMRNSFIQ